MRTSKDSAGVAELAASVGELAAGVAAEVRDRVAHGSELLAEAVTAARHELAEIIEPAPPRRRWRWLLGGGIAVAVAVALWAVLSRRPQQVEPVRAVSPADAAGGGTPVAAPAGTRNGHGSA